MQSLNYPPGHSKNRQASYVGGVGYRGTPRLTSNFNICLLATLIFAVGCFLFLMSRDLSRADELIGHAHATLVRGSAHIRAEYSTMFNPRTIEIYNAFEHDISAYYEDGKLLSHALCCDSIAIIVILMMLMLIQHSLLPPSNYNSHSPPPAPITT